MPFTARARNGVIASPVAGVIFVTGAHARLLARLLCLASATILPWPVVHAAQQCLPGPPATTAPTFQVHQNGTVTDTRRGLTWSRCMIAQQWKNGECIICPECIGGRRSYGELTRVSWEEATQYAAQSNLAGFEDWRLPTIEELRTLVDLRCTEPAIDVSIFPGTEPIAFWTSSEFADNAAYAWRIDFWDGRENADLKNTRYYRGRMVRGGKSPPQTTPQAQAQPRKPVRAHPFGDDGIHDLTNPGLDWLQNPADSLGEFPRDRRGVTDWVATLEAGQIEPRSSRQGGTDMEILDLDVVMTDTKEMPWVRFPHKTHTKWLACSNCHPKPFVQQAGANPISMNAILLGEWCGLCHGKVAFTPLVCERCHSVPIPASTGTAAPAPRP